MTCLKAGKIYLRFNIERLRIAGVATKAPHEVGVAALGDPKMYKIELFVLFNE